MIRVEVPASDAVVVIRGGPDTLWLLRSHARRLNRLYMLDGAAVFGVSVFVASEFSGSASERGILSRKLRSYPMIYRTTGRAITQSGFLMLPTFAAPHHTVVLPGLEAVEDLAAAFGLLVPNPYAEGWKEER